ncbi:putative disease resistance protein [Dichanthelium oligosanthes]|uniref:Putative disease resistance protein n=1 Tax=Dichanthelium oligosanthes TaxID=888268 RepID=A0A1E5WAI0_9POAL|nr:putative disease resistance protein [Dichanthelium oligosanthes]
MVSSSHGAMDCLLGKLGDLLTDKYKLLKEAKREVRSLQSELGNMYAFLKDMSGTQNPNEQAKCWMNEVRELSYDIDDSVDEFMLRVEHQESSSSKPQEGFKGFIDRCLSLLTTIRARHQITKEFRGLKRLAEEVSERRKRYKVDDASSKQQHDDTTIDPRMLALYTETARLVGIEGPRDELIQLMMGKDDQLKVISIMGFGGLGKTTLANEIFRKLEGQYQCRSFVPVSQKPNKWKVLRKLLSQIGYAAPHNTNMEVWDVDELISTLHKFLTDKRYFIVIDDIWDAKPWDTIKPVSYTHLDATAWSIIRCALPQNKNGSRVIATTRIEAVATACCSNDYEYVYKMKALGTEDSRRLFLKRIFGSEDTCPSYLEEVSTAILKRCGGLPLAIITLSSHLATQPNKLNKEPWEHTLNSLGSSLELNPTLEGMRQILSLSYTNLPHCLKTCVLYLGMYPEDHIISKNDLIRQWVAEGFISKAPGQDPEDIAVGYFNEIVNRSIIQPAHTDSSNDILSCRVHDMMLDLIIHKCREENFVTASDDIQDISGMLNKVRRLSLHLNGVIDGKSLGTIQLSHVRALTRFGTSTYIPPLVEFKHLRVLNLEFSGGSPQRMAMDLTGMCSLFQLRYLKIVSSDKTELPSKISGLQQLQTLEIEAHKVQIPADVVHLRRLLHLIVNGGTSYPRGIDSLKSIRTLRFCQLRMSSTDTIIEIGALTNLRDLQLQFNHIRQSESGDEEARQSTAALRSSLEKLRDLRYLRIMHDGCLDELSSLSTTPFLLRRFVTSWGWHSRLPKWIGELHSLHHLELSVKEMLGDDIRILAQLPSLTSLSVKIQANPKESMVIRRTGFSVLKHFEIRCSRVSYLTFEEGAMPRLQMLEIYFNASGWDRHGAAPAGIEHLSGLKEISVRIGGRGAKESNRRDAQSELTNAVDLHPGCPTADIMCLDDMWTNFDDNVMEEVQEAVGVSP